MVSANEMFFLVKKGEQNSGIFPIDLEWNDFSSVTLLRLYAQITLKLSSNRTYMLTIMLAYGSH